MAVIETCPFRQCPPGPYIIRIDDRYGSRTVRVDIKGPVPTHPRGQLTPCHTQWQPDGQLPLLRGSKNCPGCRRTLVFTEITQFNQAELFFTEE